MSRVETGGLRARLDLQRAWALKRGGEVRMISRLVAISAGLARNLGGSISERNSMRSGRSDEGRPEGALIAALYPVVTAEGCWIYASFLRLVSFTDDTSLLRLPIPERPRCSVQPTRAVRVDLGREG